MSGHRPAAFGVGAVALLTMVTAGEAIPPVRLDVLPFPSPLRPGPVELRMGIEAGAHSWSGVIDVAGRAARLEVDLGLPAHGRRLVIVPFRVAGGERVLEVSVDGQTVSRLDVPLQPVTTPRVLVIDDGPSAGPDPAHPSLPLDRLPEVSSALEAFDLLILPGDGAARLRPGQEQAIEQWVRWGGAVGAPGGHPMGVVRQFGAGVTITGGDIADIERMYERWRRDSPFDLARAAFAVWEASTGTGTTAGSWAPATDPRLAVLVSLAALAAGGGVCAWFPAVRRRGPQVALLLIIGGSLVTWAAARGGSASGVELAEVALVLASPDGGPCHVSAVVDVTARRSTALRFVPRMHDPLVYEMPTAALPGVQRRAVRLHADSGRWQRDLALAETAILRIAGTGPALGMKVVSHGPASWTVENDGHHHLRSVIVVGGDGEARPIGDVAPGGRARVDLGTLTSSPSRLADLEFWGRLLPQAASREPRAHPLLVAKLDPPLSTLESLDGGVRVESTSHLALSLPASPLPR